MSVEIKPSEILSVEPIGDLDGESIKHVRTIGGLNLAVGRKRGSKQEEVLAVGSHVALVRYQLEKLFPNFQPAMMKSEAGTPSEVTEMSKLLPQDMYKNGYDLFVIKHLSDADIVLTKSNMEVMSFKGSLIGSDYIVQKSDKIVTNELAKAIPATVKAAAIVALEEGKENILHSNKRFNAKQVLEKK